MADIEKGYADAGETSGTSRRGDEQNVAESKDLRGDLSESIKEKLRLLDDDSIDNERTRSRPQTQRVPKELKDKENLKKYLEPRVVSIGPYHHRNPNLNLRVNEEMKIKLARMFIKKHEVDQKHVFHMIKLDILYLRSCYEPDATREYSDDDLAWIFLIDGCVVLHFIHRCDKISENFKGLEILLAVTDKLTFQTDIMLMENQLPYSLLHMLICSTKTCKPLKESIQEFIFHMSSNFPAMNNKNLQLENHHHLLDFLRATIIFVETNNRSSVRERIIEKLFKIIGMPFNILMSIIDYLFYIILPYKLDINDLILRVNDHFLRYNIENLNEAGVELKLNITGSLTDFKFSHGTLHIPPIVVSDATPYTLLNLIIYEIFSEISENFEICSYALFLATLIDRPQDVKELRVKKILHNQRGTGDEDVVKLFKEIKIDVFRPHFLNNYAPILGNIRKHYENRKYHVWKIQLKTRYFESPWSVIGLLGVTIALIFSFLQTLYTILGYHKDKK